MIVLIFLKGTNQMKILKWLLMATGAAALIDGAVMIVISNFTTGNILLLLFGALLFVWGLKFEKIRELTRNGIGRAVRIAVTAGIAAALACCVFFAVYGCNDSVTYEEDVLIVLGCAVNGDKPTQPLAARLDIAADYARKNPDAYIVVSGGQGPQEDITEAQCMYDYLTERGIEPERIIKEEKATSTNENFRYSKKILDESLGTYTAAMVTNDFHIFRAVRLAELNGLEVTHIHADTPVSSSPVMYLREILAVIKLFIFKE